MQNVLDSCKKQIWCRKKEESMNLEEKTMKMIKSGKQKKIKDEVNIIMEHCVVDQP